uniref:Serine/threonine-protein phosphatase 2A activator n=1 Tax=Sphenodon punctatus TaxID=8508 RepID=A0A8D0GD69_SPHPU
MRKLQKTYRMEPAGSQGVWGLDDFQFLPFIWGSSQLIDHPNLEPRHFVDEKVVNENHKDYMFLECILLITEVRMGSLPSCVTGISYYKKTIPEEKISTYFNAASLPPPLPLPLIISIGELSPTPSPK